MAGKLRRKQFRVDDRLPTRYTSGLLISYLSTTSYKVSSGKCRNVADDQDIILAAERTGQTTITHDALTGFAQIDGVDEKGLDNLATSPITASQSGTTITATASVVPHYLPKNITGTLTTSGTSVTGSGTKFTEELFAGDLLGTSNGWARVASIQSDTALTLAVAIPGGDGSGLAGQVIHNATIWVGTTQTAKTNVNSIDAAGTTIVVRGTGQTVGAGADLTIGVMVENSQSAEVWAAVWLIDNGTTTALLLSTQHEELLAAPPGYDSQRRIGWLRYGDPEDGGAFLWEFHGYEMGPFQRRYMWSNGSFAAAESMPAPGSDVVATGPSTGTHAPRTVRQIQYAIEMQHNGTTGIAFLGIWPLGQGKPSNVMRQTFKDNSGDVVKYETAILDVLTGPGTLWAYDILNSTACVARVRSFVDDL